MFDWEKLVNRRGIERYQKELRVINRDSSKLLSVPYSVLTSTQKERVRLQLTIKQNGCCAICGVTEEDLNKRFSIDHCHKTDKIRGLLCTRCNSLIGFAKDNISTLQNSINYLRNRGGGVCETQGNNSQLNT